MVHVSREGSRAGVRARRAFCTFMATAVGLFGLAGCMVGPNPHTPVVRMPRGWNSPLAAGSAPVAVPTSQASSVSTAPLNVVSYWHTFNDPELDSLIDRAVDQNLNLKLAAAQIRSARASLGVSASALFPSLGQTGSYRRSFSGQSSTVTGGTVIGRANNPTDFFQFGLDASWELDLFGGQRRTVQAADLFVEAQIWSRRDVLITLLSEVATDYIRLRRLPESDCHRPPEPGSATADG